MIKKIKIMSTVILITGVAIMSFASLPSPAVKGVSDIITEKIKLSAQFDGSRFKSDKDALTMTARDYATSTWRFFFDNNDQTPDEILPSRPVAPVFLGSEGTDGLNSTWLGHSSLIINMDGYRILTDPVFERKVSVVGPARFESKSFLDPRQLAGVHVVLISHDHYDHLNKTAIQLLSPETMTFIVPLAVGKRLLSWGVPEEKIIELDWWESFSFDDRLTITATPAQHFSGRGLRDRNATLWASYVITSPGYNIFFSGDSGYFDGFKEIGEKRGPFDMTFLECGAYDDMWHAVHMFPEETVAAHMDLKGNILHPIHWGTFKLALHSWYDPMQRVTAAARENHVRIATPMAGETIVFGSDTLGSPWWEAARQYTAGHSE